MPRPASETSEFHRQVRLIDVGGATMHIVREIRKYGYIRVANAVYACGWEWRKTKHRPKTVDGMLTGMPRCELERILHRLNSSA